MKSRKQMAVVISFCICVLLCSCSSFDASGYVKAVLDSSYKNQTETYIELTGITEEDAQKIFQNNLDVTMQAFKSEKLSAELEMQYRELFGQILKQVKYSVGEAQKEKDGSYKTIVTIEPITLFDDTYHSFQAEAEVYAKSITDAVMNGEPMPSDEEIQEQVYQLYYDILKNAMDSGVEYGTAEKLELHIEKKDRKTYEIRKEDLQTLDGKLISRKLLLEEEHS